MTKLKDSKVSSLTDEISPFRLHAQEQLFIYSIWNGNTSERKGLMGCSVVVTGITAD